MERRRSWVTMGGWRLTSMVNLCRRNFVIGKWKTLEIIIIKVTGTVVIDLISAENSATMSVVLMSQQLVGEEKFANSQIYSLALMQILVRILNEAKIFLSLISSSRSENKFFLDKMKMMMMWQQLGEEDDEEQNYETCQSRKSRVYYTCNELKYFLIL